MRPIVGFTGARIERATFAQMRSFARVLELLNPSCFVHGDCIGWDYAAACWVAENIRDCVIHKYPSNLRATQANGPGAFMAEPAPPLERNTTIVRVSQIMVACPKEASEQLRSGTWSTVRRARKAGRPLVGIEPLGMLWSERLSGSWSATRIALGL